MQYRFYKQLTEVFYRPADSYIIDGVISMKSRIFGEVDDLWSTVKKDYGLKERLHTVEGLPCFAYSHTMICLLTDHHEARLFSRIISIKASIRV